MSTTCFSAIALLTLAHRVTASIATIPNAPYSAVRVPLGLAKSDLPCTFLAPVLSLQPSLYLVKWLGSGHRLPRLLRRAVNILIFDNAATQSAIFISVELHESNLTLQQTLGDSVNHTSVTPMLGECADVVLPFTAGALS